MQASTQTDALRTPAPRRRQMKNKSVLCRPFSVDQEIMCELLSPSPESEGNYIKPRAKMLANETFMNASYTIRNMMECMIGWVVAVSNFDTENGF